MMAPTPRIPRKAAAAAIFFQAIRCPSGRRGASWVIPSGFRDREPNVDAGRIDLPSAGATARHPQPAGRVATDP